MMADYENVATKAELDVINKKMRDRGINNQECIAVTPDGVKKILHHKSVDRPQPAAESKSLGGEKK